MKKTRTKSGEYRAERKSRNQTNEELVKINRKEGRFNRYQRFRIHTWFIAHQKWLKFECEKEGEKFDGSFKL